MGLYTTAVEANAIAKSVAKSQGYATSAYVDQRLLSATTKGFFGVVTPSDSRPSPATDGFVRAATKNATYTNFLNNVGVAITVPLKVGEKYVTDPIFNYNKIGNYWTFDPTLVDAPDLEDYVPQTQMEGIELTSEPQAGTPEVIVNDLTSFADTGYTSAPSNALFIPMREEYGEIDSKGRIEWFEVDCVGAEVGRTVNHFLIRPTGSNYLCVYDSGSQPCEAAGITRFTATELNPAKAEAGDIPCTFVTSIAFTTKNIKARSIGGSGATFSLVAVKPSLGGTITSGNVIPVNGFRYRCSAKFVQSNIVVSKDWIGKPFGVLGLDENGDIPETYGSANPLKGKTILVLGNSIDANGENTEPKQSISAIVGRRLSATIVNKAQGSTYMWFNNTQGSAVGLTGTTAELEALNTNFGAFSYEQLCIPFVASADLIWIKHLVNDATRFSGNMGTINSVDRATFYGAYNYLIQAIYAAKPKARIIISSQSVRYDLPGNTGNPFDVAKIDLGIEALRQICLKYNIPFCNTAINCGFNNFTKDQYTTDGLHPTLLANVGLAEYESAFLKANYSPAPL